MTRFADTSDLSTAEHDVTSSTPSASDISTKGMIPLMNDLSSNKLDEGKYNLLCGRDLPYYIKPAIMFAYACHECQIC